MEQKMLETINKEIEQAKENFEQYKNTELLNSMMLQANAKIQGMLTMLEIATGKQYYYDNDGVHEQ